MIQLYVLSKTNEKITHINTMIFILLYAIVCNLMFAFLVIRNSIITDKQFFETLIWSYLFIIEMWILDKTSFTHWLDKYIIKITDWNEKFRNLCYFILFGVGQEFSN